MRSRRALVAHKTQHIDRYTLTGSRKVVFAGIVCFVVCFLVVWASILLSVRDISDANQQTQRQSKPQIDMIVVIPIRRRDRHLLYLTNYLHEYLAKHDPNADWLGVAAMVAVEHLPSDNQPWNKGVMFNVGLDYITQQQNAGRFSNVTWIALHDVDWLPLPPTSYYPLSPDIHFQHIMPINHLERTNVGGAVCASLYALTHCLNGFSNHYWGWGAEDADLYERITSEHYLEGCTLSRSNLVNVSRLTTADQNQRPPYANYALNRAHSTTLPDEFHFRAESDNMTKQHIAKYDTEEFRWTWQRISMARCDTFGRLLSNDGLRSVQNGDIALNISEIHKHGKLEVVRVKILHKDDSWRSTLSQFVEGGKTPWPHHPRDESTRTSCVDDVWQSNLL